jgi:predicted  nucleic acid-binding Zn-ribbon protein
MTRSEYQDLAEFLGEKFDAIDRRFDAIDCRLDAIDRRLDAMDQRFDALDRRLDAMDQRFDALEGRLEKVEVTVEENRHLIQLVAENVTGLRKKMDREFVAVRQEMADGFQLQGNAIRGLGARMDRWEGLSA